MSHELSKELKLKAKWAADMMRADGVTPAQVASLNEEQQTDLAMAYMEAIGRKIEQFQNIYFGRSGAKDAMQSYVKSALITRR